MLIFASFKINALLFSKVNADYFFKVKCIFIINNFEQKKEKTDNKRKTICKMYLNLYL